MSRPRILVTHPLFPAVRELLNHHFEAEYWKEPQPMPREELLARVADKEGLVCLLTDKINDELLDKAPKLKIAATVSVGYDNIDVPACTRHKVFATNTPRVLDDTTADLAWALLMAVARRVVEGDTMIRTGKWTGWEIDQFMGSDVWGKTLGIIGFGRIGQEMARRASGFKMKILYHNRNRVPEEVEKEFVAAYVDLDTLLRESDFVSVHAPLTPETRHLINRGALEKMKPTAYLINTARGPVVDEPALAEILAERKIAGAGLDVFEREPHVFPGLLPLSNVVLTPHVGSGSVETRTNMGLRAAKNVVAFFEGEKPADALNPELFGAR
jgi:glyoxylate reductase